MKASDLAAIAARHERAFNPTAGVRLPNPLPWGDGQHLIRASEAEWQFYVATHKDVPALVAEVKRLRGLVEAAYREGWVEDGDFTIKSAWNQSESKRQLTEEGVL